VQREFFDRKSHDGWVIFIFALALFLAMHLLLSVALSGSFSPDDADQLIFSQSFAWGYYEQPPLYSWLTYLFVHSLGLSYLSYYLVKSLSLGLVYLMSFLAARSAGVAKSVAPLAAFSPLLIPTFAWHSFTYLTSTNLVCAATFATYYALLKVKDSGRTADYILLGMVVGLGFLSKYNFLIVAATLVGAALTIPAFRVRLLRWRALLTLAVAAACAAGNIAWLVHHRSALTPLLAMKLQTNQSEVFARALGVWRVCSNAGLILLPFVVLYLVLRRNAKASERAGDATRLLVRFFTGTIITLLLLVLITGATRVHERWLQPFALLVPLLAWTRHDFTAGTRRTFAACLVVMALVCAVARGTQIFVGGLDRGQYPLRMNFSTAADEIRPLLQDGAVVISRDREICGNLRYVLPEALHLCSAHPLYRPRLPQHLQGAILVWNSAAGEIAPPDLRAFANGVMAIDLPLTTAVRFVEVPSRIAGRRSNRLAYVFASKAAAISP